MNNTINYHLPFLKWAPAVSIDLKRRTPETRKNDRLARDGRGSLFASRTVILVWLNLLIKN